MIHASTGSQAHNRLMAAAVFISVATVSNVSNAASCGPNIGKDTCFQPRKFARVAECPSGRHTLEKRPVFDLKDLPRPKKLQWT